MHKIMWNSFSLYDINYIKESLPWGVYHKRGVIVTSNSAKLALNNFLTFNF